MAHVYNVKPAKAVPRSVIKVSPIDMLAANISNATFFPFTLYPRDIPVLKVVDALREGLSYALVEFPTMLGHVGDANDGSTYKTVTVTPESTVRLVFKDWTTAENRPHWPFGLFDELERLRFPPSMLPRALLTDDYPPGNGPVYTVQVNHLGFGGLILSLRTNHAALDGIGHGTFQNRWAHHTAAVMTGQATIPDDVRESRDRTPILYGESVGTDIAKAPFLRWQTRVPDFAKWLAVKRNLTVWSISAANAAALKETVLKDSPEGTRISTADAYGALIWRSMILARGVPGKGFKTAKCFVATNIRHHLQPAQSRNYIGNGVLPSPAVATDVSSWSSSTPLCGIALTLRQTIARYNPDTVRDTVLFLKGLEAAKKNGQISELAGDTFDGPDSGITNLSRYDWLDGQNWGPSMGKPLELRRSTVMAPGMVMIYPRHPDGSLSFETNLEEDATERLKVDPEFRKYVDFVCA